MLFVVGVRVFLLTRAEEGVLFARRGCAQGGEWRGKAATPRARARAPTGRTRTLQVSEHAAGREAEGVEREEAKELEQVDGDQQRAHRAVALCGVCGLAC